MAKQVYHLNSLFKAVGKKMSNEKLVSLRLTSCFFHRDVIKKKKRINASLQNTIIYVFKCVPKSPELEIQYQRSPWIQNKEKDFLSNVTYFFLIDNDNLSILSVSPLAVADEELTVKSRVQMQ